MTRTVLWGRVLSDGDELPAARIEIEDGTIVHIQPGGTSRGADVLVEDGWIIPGLIDLQVNGAAGTDLTSAPDPVAALSHVATTLAQHGVTAFCPTVISAPPEVMLERVRAYRAQAIRGGAQSLGAHLEGPFLAPTYRGVHPPQHLRPPSPEEIADWLRAGPPRLVTLAPEQPGGLAAISQLASQGVVVSLGHSAATASDAQAALAAGAQFGTHLFNAMPPLHHRQPGLAGALLASTRRLGIIADGAHLAPLMVELVVRWAGPRRIALVSDATAVAGAGVAQAVLGDQPIVSDGRAARRPDGSLAGGAVLLDACLRNARGWLRHLPPAAVVQLATGTPAALLGLHRKGRVAVGCDADLAILDADWHVRATLIGGALIPPAPLS